MKIFKKLKGFTLLEVMLAGGILGIGCLGVLAMLTTAQESNNISASSTNAIVVGETIISNLENEARTSCSLSAGTAGALPSISCPSAKRISRINDAAENTWVLFDSDSGLVNTLAQSKALAGNTSTVPLRYCVGFYKLNSGHANLINGSLRIFWRKDNKAITQDDCKVDGKSFDDLDSISGARSSGLEFISLPFSFRIE